MKTKCLIVLFLVYNIAFATNTPEQYIEKYKDDAIKEMHEYAVPASITLAQGMLESSFGNSVLAQNANNHFGIKCHSSWAGDTYHMDDDTKNECFRKYNHVLESYRDHSEFLKTRSRYASLFNLKITDYKAWAEGLKAAGYATNPKYPQLLINMIERYGLQQYDTYPKKEIVENVIQSREILLSRNYVKYVVAGNGETFQSLSKQFNIRTSRLLRYNDAVDTTSLKAGDYVYLQPKRKKGTGDLYYVGSSDSYRSISQKFSIKLKYLYKINNIAPGTSPTVGEPLSLKKKRK